MLTPVLNLLVNVCRIGGRDSGQDDYASEGVVRGRGPCARLPAVQGSAWDAGRARVQACQLQSAYKRAF